MKSPDQKRHPYSIDTIRHEGAYWLVPEWYEDLAAGTMQPARMIRVQLPDHHPAPETGFDFALDGSIPIDVLEGRTDDSYDVVTRPDIWIANPNAGSLH